MVDIQRQIVALNARNRRHEWLWAQTLCPRQMPIKDSMRFCNLDRGDTQGYTVAAMGDMVFAGVAGVASDYDAGAIRWCRELCREFLRLKKIPCAVIFGPGIGKSKSRVIIDFHVDVE